MTNATTEENSNWELDSSLGMNDLLQVLHHDLLCLAYNSLYRIESTNSNPDHVIFYGYLLYQVHLFQGFLFQGHDLLVSQDFHSMLTVISDAKTFHCLYQILLLMAFTKTQSQVDDFAFCVLKVLLVF